MTSENANQNPDKANTSANTNTASPAPGSDLFRRLLLLLITALLVARPLVSGENPGLLTPQTEAEQVTSPPSDSSNLMLSSMWLILALGWALWRFATHETKWQAGLVEGFLLLSALAVFLSAGIAAQYKHPAWLIAWEWVTFVLAIFLIRQLAVTLTEQRCVLAALLANVISIAVLSVYQHHYQIPEERQSLQQEVEAAQKTIKRQRARERRENEPIQAASGGPLWTAWQTDRRGRLFETRAEEHLRRLQKRQRTLEKTSSVSGTFFYSQSLAGFLVLLIPSLMVICWMRWQSVRANWQTWMTLGGLLLTLYALWLTQSRSALIGLLLMTGVATVMAAPRLFPQQKRIVQAVVVLGIGASTYFLLDDPGTLRQAQWSSTWSMIQNEPWLGVGPGNFERHYPQYASAQTTERPTTPPSFLLEIWSTTGIFTLVLLLASLGAFVRLMLRHFANVDEPAEDPDQPTESGRERWEFYVAGMLGLFFGFVLRVSAKAPEQILDGLTTFSADAVRTQAILACARSMLWFASFALMERVLWQGKGRVAGLALGAGAFLIHLCLSGGITASSLTQPFWVVVGLTLAGLSIPARQPKNAWASRALPLPLMGGVAMVYLVTFAFSTVESYRLTVRGAQAERSRPEKGTSWGKHQTQNIIPQFEAAALSDPGSSYQWQLLSRALMEHYLWLRQNQPDNKDAIGARERAQTWILAGLKRDPRNTSLLGDQAKMLYLTVEWEPHTPKDAFDKYCRAATALKRIVSLDPTRLQNHYQLVEAYVRMLTAFDQWEPRNNPGRLQKLVESTRSLSSVMAVEPVRINAPFSQEEKSLRDLILSTLREAAGRTLALDSKAGPERKLTPSQRARLKRWRN